MSTETETQAEFTRRMRQHLRIFRGVTGTFVTPPEQPDDDELSAWGAAR